MYNALSIPLGTDGLGNAFICPSSVLVHNNRLETHSKQLEKLPRKATLVHTVEVPGLFLFLVLNKWGDRPKLIVLTS